MVRVVVWSTGTVGRHAIAGVDAHPGLELAGVWVSDPAKIGRDAGELAGLGRELGVRATHDRDELIEAKPDAIIHAAMTDDRPFEAIDDLVGFLEAGINVVSSGPVLLQYPDDPELIRRIDEAGKKNNASLHVNGIDPGFANDVLPLALTSLSRRIDELRVMEIADYSTYRQPVVMRELFGFGQPLEDKAVLWQPGILSLAWGSVVRQLAAGLGVTLDQTLIEAAEHRPAEKPTRTASVDIDKGTRAAVRFTLTGTVNQKPRIILEHVTRTSPDQCPDWPKPQEGDGCYRVEVRGEPVLNLELAHHGEHGDHNDSGMITTAQRLVNALPHVVDAEPGLVTALDLPLVTGKGLVTR